MELPSLHLKSLDAASLQLLLNIAEEVRLAQVLEILHNLVISENKEAVASVLISLPAQLRSNQLLALLDFLLVVLLLINKYATTPASYTFANTDLSSDCAWLFVLIPDKGQLIQKVLQLDTLLIQVVVITNDSSSYEGTLTSDRVRRIQLDHIRCDASLQTLDTFIDR